MGFQTVSLCSTARCTDAFSSTALSSSVCAGRPLRPRRAVACDGQWCGARRSRQRWPEEVRRHSVARLADSAAFPPRCRRPRGSLVVEPGDMIAPSPSVAVTVRRGVPAPLPQPLPCQSASNFDPRSACNFDPFEPRVRVAALAPSELVGVAETGRARVVG
jgi:hypothetical protein